MCCSFSLRWFTPFLTWAMSLKERSAFISLSLHLSVCVCVCVHVSSVSQMVLCALTFSLLHQGVPQTLPASSDHYREWEGEREEEKKRRVGKEVTMSKLSH